MNANRVRFLVLLLFGFSCVFILLNLNNGSSLLPGPVDTISPPPKTKTSLLSQAVHRSVQDLLDVSSFLTDQQTQLFKEWYHVQKISSSLRVPETLIPWIQETFGPVDKAEAQTVIKVQHQWTLAGTVFNPLRAHRPFDSTQAVTTDAATEHGRGTDDFCNAETRTAEDVFGRVRGQQSITASNIAKMDKWHGVLVFEEHNPLRFTEASVVDALRTADRWFHKAHHTDKTSKYPFALWQCLWRSGASLIHGHMQMLLASDTHFGAVERLNDIRLRYEDGEPARYTRKTFQHYHSEDDAHSKHSTSTPRPRGRDYFDDWFHVHQWVGLALERTSAAASVRILAHMAPVKEREVVLLASQHTVDRDQLLADLGQRLFQVLQTFRDDLGVQSFTVGMYGPPLAPTAGWQGFPMVVHVADRGPLSHKSSDVGGLELFGGTSVVNTDPFEVIAALRKRILSP